MSPNTIDNEAIITGNNDVIKYIYENYFPRLTVFAKSIVNNEDEAKDIVQNILTKIWFKNLSFHSNAHLKTYMYNSVKNSCINHLKKQQETVNEQPEEFIDDIERKIISTEIKAEILFHINNLPKARRDVLLSKIEGMKVEDIALKYNISKDTVKRHISLAKKDLSRDIPDIYILLLLFFNI